MVLNWHGRAETLQCLHALAALSYPNLAVILIDNDCREFTADELSQLVADGRYVSTDVNLGFAAGANLGMRHALDARAEYVWFLNNDAQPEPDALRELIAVAEQSPAIAIVGPKILQAQDPQRLDSIALDVNLRSGRIYLTGHDEADHGQYDQLTTARAVTGCAMLVSRVACERLGGFDERFFAYLEDADLCLRAGAAGFRVAVAPRARVRHQRPAATRGRQSVASLYYTARNHLILLERHGRGPFWWRPLRAAWIIVLNLLYAVRAADTADAMARVGAVCQGVRAYRCRSARS